MSVRVRFAPSPTGFLHVGGARTALFNWLFARRHGGVFILRIEDTDRTRYVPGAVEDIMSSLRWLGLEWDEGPEVGGPYGPYFQSQRLDIYREYAHRLVKEGRAYYCYCSPERLAALRREQRARKEPPGYDRRCRNLTARERAQYEAQGIVPVVRLKVPLEGKTSFYDLIRGEITVDNRTLDDLVLLKSDGYPTYHLANVVDDHLMEITHVMRADEWIPSTPRHVLLYQAFGWEPPKFAHLPIILSPSGKGKLSKRHGATSVNEFRKQGYLPEAMFNFLALLGWAYDDRTDIFDREQAIARFDLEGVHKAPASFSYDKLEWMNGVYIRRLPPEELALRLLPFYREAGFPADERLLKELVPLIQERIKKLADAIPLTDFLFVEELSYEPELLIQKGMNAQECLAALERVREALAELPAFDKEMLEARLRALAQELGLKTRQLFGLIRVATTGKTVAPPLFGSLSLLGKKRTLARIERALSLLREMASS